MNDFIQDLPEMKTKATGYFLRDFAESARDAIVCCDTSGEIRIFNHQAEKIFGYSNVEIVGQPITCLIPENTMAAHEAGFAKWVDRNTLLAGSSKRSVIAKRKDGTELSIELSLNDLLFDGRNYVIAFIHDTSAKEARRRKTRLLQAAFSAAAHSTVITTVDGRIVWVNPAFTALTGYTAAEAIGEKTSLLKSGQQDDKFYTDLWQTVLAGKTWRGTLINRKKNDSVYLERQTITPVVGETGSIEHFIAVKEDVTNAVQLQQDLRETRDQYRRLFENSPLALWEEDYSAAKKYIDELRLSGVGDLRAYFDEHPEAVTSCASMIKIIDVNEAAVKLAGVASKTDLLGDLVSVFSKPSFEQFKDQLLWLAAGNLRYEAEVENTLRDGQSVLLDLRLNISPEFAESWSEVIISSADITERKLREKQLAHAMKMDAVGQLTGGIAHDFNNILTVVTGNLRLLLETSSHEMGAETKEMIADVLSAADDGAELTSRLRAFSRKPVSQARQLGADAVIRDFTELLKPVLGSNIKISTEIADDLNTLLTDKNTFGNVLLNLAINARDAMSDGGNLTFKACNGSIENIASMGELKVAAPRPCIVVEVIDSGSGMSADVVDHATEPFFTTKEIDEGNGLGLSMVQDFVIASGGELEIDSKVGVGTKITLYLPLQSGNADAALRSR